MTFIIDRRFYFRIPSCNIYECVFASSAAEARVIVQHEYCGNVNEIEWLTPMENER
jgi:hypothetical protein